MKINMLSKFCTHSLILAGGLPALLLLASLPVYAQDMSKRPSLIITNERLPDNVAPTGGVYSSNSYSKNTGNLYGNRARPMENEITPSQVSGSDYFQPTQTVVGKKVDELRNDLSGLKSRVNNLSSQLKSM